MEYEIDANGCWIWAAKPLRSGYCRAKRGGVEMVAHRYIYEKLRGPIPAGLQLDHLCRNRRCVNPDHLEPVTAAENQRRGTSPASENANKTHCKRGHELSGKNLRVRRDGRRRCEKCERENQKRLRRTAKYRDKHAAYERTRRQQKKGQLHDSV